MPLGPVDQYTGLGVAVMVFMLALATSVFTAIASAVLLWRYRSTVERLMTVPAEVGQHHAVHLADSQRESPPAAQDSTGRPRPLPREGESGDHLYQRTRSGPLGCASWHALGGSAAALFLAVTAFLAFSQLLAGSLRSATHPLQFLFLLVTFAWPTVLTINIVAATSPLKRRLNVVVYAVLLTAIGAALALTPTESVPTASGVALGTWSGETPIRLVAKWSVFNLAPTVLILVFRHRRVRAVAPLVLAFVTTVLAGVAGVIGAAFIFQDVSVKAIAMASAILDVSSRTAMIGYFLLLCTVTALVFGMLGWSLMAWIRRGYRRRTISEQSLAIDAVWALFAAFYAVGFGAAGLRWSLSPLVAFAILKAAIAAGNRRWHSSEDSREYHPALLVLRVFALGTRSEVLFEAVTRRWRYVGHIRLIAGMDLALSTVAPHQFLAFVTGKLRHLFIGSEAAAERAVAALDDARARDGRFRINDFFCHADTWQRVLRKLIASTDVVLMDLRSFSERNAGCVFEIQELLGAMPFARLVFVVDEGTDKDYLALILKEACARFPSDSPNSGRSPSMLELFELESRGRPDVQPLLRRLCAAAFSGPGMMAESFGGHDVR
jgi:hypothetical protein